ncbi:MAG: FecR domain-containing protein, partial [Myxococcota bacterium]
MSELRQRLEAMPEPDPSAVDRLWVRFQTTQALEGRRRRQRWVAGGGVLAFAAAAVGLWLTAPELPREQDLSARVTPSAHEWSPWIHLEALGEGSIAGTSRDATVDWTSGTVRVSVEPNTDTSLSVVTKEAHVHVVGTKFDVHRDALGSTVSVEHGRVAVECGDG